MLDVFQAAGSTLARSHDHRKKNLIRDTILFALASPRERHFLTRNFWRWPDSREKLRNLKRMGLDRGKESKLDVCC